MLAYIARRLLSTLPVMGLVALVLFAILRLTPGDPAAIIAGDVATSAQVDQIRQNMGLDKPIYLQFFVWEQSGFALPDNIVMPLWYGSNVLGCQRGFDELVRNGEIERSPRLFGVQAANCAPLFAAFERGADLSVNIDVRPTVAEGVASAKPTRAREVLQAVRRSGGAIAAVSEDEIISALRSLSSMGLFVEPTSAVAAAGLSQLITAGAITPPQSIVMILTVPYGNSSQQAEKQFVPDDGKAYACVS